MSAVSFGEIRKGIVLKPPGKRRTELEVWLETDLSILFSGRILPLTRSIAERWGALLDGQCQAAGKPRVLIRFGEAQELVYGEL